MKETKAAYRVAFDDWLAKVMELHKVLLHGERLPPPQLKGLLNREARAKETYDAARRKLLGLSD